MDEKKQDNIRGFRFDDSEPTDKESKVKGFKFSGESGSQEKCVSDKNLDDFIDSEFNLKIYEYLTDGEGETVFDEPLVFFRLLYEQFDFISNNQTKPVTVINALKALPLIDDQRRILFFYLCKLLRPNQDRYSNDQKIICQKLLIKEYNKLVEKIEQPESAFQDERSENVNLGFENSFYESARNLRQKVLFYLVTKHRVLLEPETITRAQLARNIAEVTNDKVSGIIDVLQSKLKAKEGSADSAKILATDLRAVYLELKGKDDKACQIIKNEIHFLSEDIKNS